MKMYKPFYLSTILVSAFALTACGGSGDSNGGSSSRTTGVVTLKSTDSVTVASTSFSTSSSSVSGDEIGTVNDVQVGMVVSVESDNMGNATDIDYDAEVEGIVQNISADTMVVLGQNVDISQNPTFQSEVAGVTSIQDIPVGAMVEVSGYSDGMGNILATYVELEDLVADPSEEMELEGIVTTLDLVNGTFMIGNQVIHFDPNNISLTMEEGLNVEVDLMMVGDEVHATEIEIEHDYSDEHEEGHEIEIEGMITGGLGTDNTFAINGEIVMLADNVEYENGLTAADIVEGAMLEVEGYLNDQSMLVVTEVELPGSSDDVSESSDTSSDSPDLVETPDSTTI